MRRRLALGTGLAVAAVYAASAAVSGHVSPLARRPLLDGLVPPTPYRWVEPPPELQSTNLAPSAGSFGVQLGGAGSRTAVLTTDDAQVTLILPRGVFPAVSEERSVSVEVEPLAPSAVRAPEEPTQILGNVYRIEATYRTSGEPAPLEGEARVVLVYPQVANDHGGHEVLVSADGRRWRGTDSNDLPSIQQVDGPVPTFGYLAVGGTPPSPTASETPDAGEGSSNAATIAIVAGLVVLAIGTAILLRPGRGRPSRRRTGSATGSRPSRSRSSRRD